MHITMMNVWDRDSRVQLPVPASVQGDGHGTVSYECLFNGGCCTGTPSDFRVTCYFGYSLAGVVSAVSSLRDKLQILAV